MVAAAQAAPNLSQAIPAFPQEKFHQNRPQKPSNHCANSQKQPRKTAQKLCNFRAKIQPSIRAYPGGRFYLLETALTFRQYVRPLNLMDVKLPKLGEGADSGVVVNIFV